MPPAGRHSAPPPELVLPAAGLPVQWCLLANSLADFLHQQGQASLPYILTRARMREGPTAPHRRSLAY